ncbi:putative WD40 repeat-containing protein [Monocercomonoides exilis]|uniref:putative WD40 repeat-containing protein n=1 Tax=Monocercomonoides exilis TaxID=2049356 RepID=UPI00355A4A62|nr:putative WD40 repeat-containing protein [Monocercomonoides exilis]|eukprot:MONOS_11728.1-p1 / transcript=MONOS_11728.1 / gene=MONOS_11728 / organism=Monocercomonoides_exilis_PA203 / gene_product=WD40 repeat-containing protein / transcript_product=WD40 repeat-containing protein / location=Mono_scaffold00605:35180-37939(-) / protein_length=749 / sequence_SO=supercontig / SO=protein_coding / is_pseudo=false
MSGESPLSLEHAIGGTRILYSHPTQHNLLIHTIGAVCVISNLDDIHNQVFLRRHTEAISALSVSEHFIATGQVGRKGTREPAAPICIWRIKDESLVACFEAHVISVTALAFSPDERFLASGGEDCTLCIWDLKTGSRLASTKVDKPISSLAFAMTQSSSQGASSSATPSAGAGLRTRAAGSFVRPANPNYRIFVASGTTLRSYEISWSIASQCYILGRAEAAGLPSTGFVRSYPTCVIVGDDLISGTDSGEIVVFSLSNRIYRMHKRACSGSVLSFCSGHCGYDSQTVVVGGGHGVVVIFEGRDTSYNIVDVVDLPCEGDVLCLSRFSEDSFIALSSRGAVYRIDRSTEHEGKYVYKLVFQTPPSPQGCVAFPPSSSEVFCTASSCARPGITFSTAIASSSSSPSTSASIMALASSSSLSPSSAPHSALSSQPAGVRVWDLSDYAELVFEPLNNDVSSMAMGVLPHRTQVKGGAAGATGTAAPMGELVHVDAIVTGHVDGTLKAHDAHTGTQLWSVLAHRGMTSAVNVGSGVVLSGGEDGRVRCWSGRTHETLAEFKEHTRGVRSVLVDIADNKIAHSCSTDKTICCFDLEEEKKVNGHITVDEVFECMCQRPDGERELITGAQNGIVSVWDWDAPDSVSTFATESKATINSIAISSSGRYLAVCNDDGDVIVYDMRNVKIVLPPVSVLHGGRIPPPQKKTHVDVLPPVSDTCGKGHSAAARSLAWSPDEKQLVSVGDDCGILIWNFYG